MHPLTAPAVLTRLIVAKFGRALNGMSGNFWLKADVGIEASHCAYPHPKHLRASLARWGYTPPQGGGERGKCCYRWRRIWTYFNLPPCGEVEMRERKRSISGEGIATRAK
ncbi:hypothetical protein GCM10008941_38310 [Rhizomicrobium palustre]